MPNLALDLPNVSSLEDEEAKDLLRSYVREHRQQRSDQARAHLAELWKDTVLEFIGDRKIVAGFVSTHFEPPTLELCKVIADAGKTLLLPKLGPGLTRAWGYFKGVDDLVQMAPGRPPEPSGPAFDNEILLDVDVIVLPALLMSYAGERLGQGGGWYDRALKEKGEQTLVGAMVFPEELVHSHIPQTEFDVPIPYVLRPAEIVETTAAQQ
ncbi:5-formyltetrahydrofolate cyclo-ligase [Arcanobacterium bovis]|uniref:5-formyltetrahydrofolate cyclo-ligase n=1 Tax=Arcanobacterium bovis TaxID=2529275 RepID=A0A4Q9V2C3_9ACTO|nr:5-formyltetrahydrofolate cyclo-ligase [Arcanobacterium bovis]TBW23799.1 5-formyltetrahydrofolate cyclo-ligase [Arcanobacterium bovis]